MYTEEPRKRIDWPYLLRKIIIIVLIVLLIFLIVWLINKGIKNNKVKNNYNNNTNIKENIKGNTNNNDNNSGLSNPEYYSESFITNYMYFHNNARDFVEKNNLPIENNSVTYTLQELINKGIILPTSYGNNSCDTENSYIVVTNNDGKYTMTTTLICGKEIAKTTEELKCSGLCTNCGVIVEDECKDKDCNNTTALEYEFKQSYKATDTVYSCPSGYTKTGSGNNTKCIKNDSNVVSPTKNTTYTCPSGYTKTGSGNNTKCIKNSTETVKATINTIYTCSDGSKPNKDNMCPVTTPAKTTYSCSDGSKPNKDNMCPVTTPAKTTYSCSDGSKPNKDNMCPVTTPAKTTYSCSDGSKPNKDNMCPVTTPASTTYTCSDGSKPVDNKCYRYTTGSYYESYTTYHNKTYNGCSYVGPSVEKCTECIGKTRTVHTYKCSKTSRSSYPATATTTPATTTYVKANATTTPAKTTYIKANATTTPASTTYVKANATTTPAKTTYVKATAKVENICSNGILSGNNCTISKVDTINPSINVSYNCPTGYTKNGLASTAICTKGNVITVNPTKENKEVTKYKTKWSTETSIPGWTRTGNTRTVKAS